MAASQRTNLERRAIAFVACKKAATENGEEGLDACTRLAPPIQAPLSSDTHEFWDGVPPRVLLGAIHSADLPQMAAKFRRDKCLKEHY